jgi:hypothetical protein
MLPLTNGIIPTIKTGRDKNMTTLPDPRPSPPAPLAIPLTAHHIRFTVRATTPIRFGDFTGSALRGALVNVLRRTFCPEGRGDRADLLLDPVHQALCPVCRMLTWEGDESGMGDVRRAYAIEPFLDDLHEVAPGEFFDFGVALYGDNLAFFPYLALTTGGMGEFGIGLRVAGGAGADDECGRLPRHPPPATYYRGQFVVEQIEAVNPLLGERVTLMAAGDRMVRTVTLPVTHDQVLALTDQWVTQLVAHHNQLQVVFQTPLRLITQGEHTLKRPEFFPFAKAVARRLLDLAAQHGGGRPTIHGQPIELKRDLYPYADQVQLVEDQTHWWDVKGYSGRIGRTQVLGGLVGYATYYAPDWRPLLPWLLWGVSAHVGKNIVKGCGMYRLAVGSEWQGARMT